MRASLPGYDLCRVRRCHIHLRAKSGGAAHNGPLGRPDLIPNARSMELPQSALSLVHLRPERAG